MMGFDLLTSVYRIHEFGGVASTTPFRFGTEILCRESKQEIPIRDPVSPRFRSSHSKPGSSWSLRQYCNIHSTGLPQQD